ncbi:MAG: c-type cytochrome biogenesis protein CcsB [Planctomycetales bacterium 4484_113]|nr:MAG: c-type cytochrome biogenesis protein CcsB [Planctomycetales bacterium 4484_113]
MQTSLVYILIALFAWGFAFLLFVYALLLRRHLKLNYVASALLLVGSASLIYWLIARTAEYWRQYQGFVLPATNLFESIVFISLLVVLFYVVADLLTGVREFGAYVLILPLAGLVYLVAHLSGEAGMPELPPALKSYWLPFHIITMFISYAAFTMAAVVSLYYILKVRWGIGFRAIDLKHDPERIDRLSYYLVSIAYPFLTAGIFLGAVWADQAWGRYWGWDPKETWSAITWLLYTLYLHARLAYGWRGLRAAIFNFIAYDAVIITFIGVNLLSSLAGIESIHSYAVGKGGLITLIVLFALIVGPLVLAFWPTRRRVRNAPERPEGSNSAYSLDPPKDAR